MNLDPQLDTALYGLLVETESRELQMSPIPTIDFPATSNIREFLAFPGTVSIYVARKGSGVLNEIRAALGTGAGATNLMKRLHKPAENRAPMTLSDAADFIAKLPTYGEVRYGGRVLMQNLCVPDGFEAVMTALPYNGGELERDGFAFAQYRRTDAPYDLEAIALVHAPPLSDVQKAALRAVPKDQASMNVGTASRCYALCATAVAVVVTVAATLCCGTGKSAAAWEMAEKSAALSDDDVKKMGPAATAKQLLAARRRILRDECPSS